MSIFNDYLLREPRGKATGIFNVDDDYGRRFAQQFLGNTLTFGVDQPADIKADNVRTFANLSTFDVTKSEQTFRVQSHLVGLFNVQNVLAAIGAGLSADIPMLTILQGLGTLEAVPGRLEQINEGQDFQVLVDYAHTPDALERVLANTRGMSKGKLIVVFGCGGDRDPGKRPIMGKTAGDRADYIIITNDNPRTEDPGKIADQVAEGVSSSKAPAEKVRRILDRKEAICHALATAVGGDVVIIAGKGHEDYQILGQEKVHFDDREVAREYLKGVKK